MSYEYHYVTGSHGVAFAINICGKSTDSLMPGIDHIYYMLGHWCGWLCCYVYFKYISMIVETKIQLYVHTMTVI